MEKPADATYPIEELLKRRWSPRAFADRPVEPEKLLSLWEAARWSASTRSEAGRVMIHHCSIEPCHARAWM
jgi:nitroreductase